MSFEQLELPLSAPLATPAGVPSFSEAISRIGSWTDLPEARRRDMVSALKTAARILGRNLEAIPCDVTWLNQELFGRPPAAFGLERGRFNNITSLLRAVLRRLGLHAPRARGPEGMTAEWAALIAAVPEQGQRAGLRGFARFCSARGIQPMAVTNEALAEYVALDRANRLSASAAQRGGIVALAWNKAVRAALPGFPPKILKAPSRREPYTLLLDVYPESFRSDLAAYVSRLGGTDATGKPRGRYIRAADAPRRPLSPRSVEARRFAIRQAAGILVSSGVPIEDLRSLRDLVDPIERVETVLEFLADRHATKNNLPAGAEVRGGQVATVAETFRQIAQHHCKLTGELLAQIRSAAKAASRPQGSGMSPKVRARLHAMVQREPRGLLLWLPNELMTQARRLRKKGRLRDAARHALWAAALDLLLFCPLREGSLLALRLDQHLVHLDPRSRLPTRLSVRGEITKNGEPLEWPIPKASAALIREYLDIHRPVIAATDNTFLFPGGDGTGALSANALATALVKLVDEFCGVRINLHMVRHFAAWRYLKEHPGHYEDVRRLLGHRNIATTTAYYIAFETEAVAARFDGVILKEKRETRLMAAAAFSKRQRGTR
jgi:integrase